VNRAFAQSGSRVYALTANASDAKRAFLDSYLSGAHRDDPGTGCAMAALACAGQPGLTVSFAEAGPEFSGSATFYSVDLVREYRKRMPRRAHLYFVVGLDAFLEISTWRRPKALLDSCDFVVVTRPGFHLDSLRNALPAGMFLPGRGNAVKSGNTRRTATHEVLRLRRSAVHLVSSVHVDISSTEIRRRAARGRSIRGLVPAAVEDYIWKQALYR
jgi:nicotinate-nucleotide adenylyltransferase